MHRLGLLFLCVAVSACTGVGPETVAHDRFDYGNAILESGKRETLQNLLRLRYGEVPVFLEVTSVINQYTLEGNLGAAYAVPIASIGSTVGLSGGAKWSDRPTITYVPMAGEMMIRRLMKPLDPSAILVLMQGGWPADFIFPLTVRQVNGLQNEATLAHLEREGDGKFARVVEILTQSQREGDLGVRIEEREKGDATVLFFTRRGQTSEESMALLREMQDILGLNPEAKEYFLTYGTIPKNDTEITLLTRSVLSIMVELASWIDVPEKHVLEKRTRPTRKEAVVVGYAVKPPINIHHGSSAPSTAYAAAEFRGKWFWLDDRDFPSKRAFAFLQFMFSLMGSNTRQIAPVVTVGAGG